MKSLKRVITGGLVVLVISTMGTAKVKAFDNKVKVEKTDPPIVFSVRRTDPPIVFSMRRTDPPIVFDAKKTDPPIVF